MSQAVRRQLCRANLPPEPDRTTEFTIPHPQVVTRQPWNRRTVWERDRRTLRFSIDLVGHETFGILLDSRELVPCGLRTEVVRGPTLLEGIDISREVSRMRPYEI